MAGRGVSGALLRGADRDRSARIAGDRHHQRRRRRFPDHPHDASNSSASTRPASSARASATFKQGIGFHDWLHAPARASTAISSTRSRRPSTPRASSLVPYWLLQDEATRPPFAEAMTIQNRVAEAQRAPKRPGEGDYRRPAQLCLSFRRGAARRGPRRPRAVELGVRPSPGAADRASSSTRTAASTMSSHRAAWRARRPISISTAGLSRRADRQRARRAVQVGAAPSCSPTAHSPARCPTTGPTRRSKASPSPPRTRRAGPGTSV